MNEWTLTKVYEIDHRLVIADTVENAIALYRKYADGEEPTFIRTVKADISNDPDAIITEKNSIVKQKRELIDKAKEFLIKKGYFSEIVTPEAFERYMYEEHFADIKRNNYT